MPIRDTKKYRLIIKPFLLITISFIAALTIFHIILLKIYTVLPFREDAFRFVAPLLLPWIPMLIWLRPGLKHLRYRKGRQHVFGYLFLAGIAMSVPSLILQSYVPQVVSRYTKIETAGQINNFRSSRYYQITSFYAENKALNQFWLQKVTGRYGHTLEFHHYAILPMYADSMSVSRNEMPHEVDTSATKINLLYYGEDDRNHFLNEHPPIAWLCLHDKEAMDNKSLNADKTERWEQFTNRRVGQMQDMYWDTVKQWEQMTNDIDLQRILALIPSHNKLLLLTPRNSPVHPRHAFFIIWILASLVMGVAIYVLVIKFTPIMDD